MFTAEMMAVEAERECAEQMAPAATLSDAHSQWHAVHGRYAVCPMDCGVGEQFEHDGPIVVCGFCKRHETVAEVRECAKAHYEEMNR